MRHSGQVNHGRGTLDTAANRVPVDDVANHDRLEIHRPNWRFAHDCANEPSVRLKSLDDVPADETIGTSDKRRGAAHFRMSPLISCAAVANDLNRRIVQMRATVTPKLAPIPTATSAVTKNA
jgi:hypothetical protein